MKKLTISLLASIAVAATSFAGTEISAGKKVVTPPSTCFNDHELQLDIFGAYSVGNGPDHAGPIRDHAWGGGIGVTYFFTRYIGIGAEGLWEAGQDNAASVGTGHNGRTTFHNADGSLIFRLPIDQYCIAPYGFVGGGAAMDSANWADVFVGVGVEYRVVPLKVGIFADGRWNYYGDRYDRGDQNDFTLRAGVRLVF
jgi:Outer membrane protein beta-barrel domain